MSAGRNGSRSSARGRPVSGGQSAGPKGRGQAPGQADGKVKDGGGQAQASGKSKGQASGSKGKGAAGGLRGRSTARETALYVLTEVDTEGAYSNLLLNGAIQNAGLSGPDVGLATELVYGTISRRTTIDYFLAKFVSKGLDKLQPWVRNLLRLSFYQLYYLDRIPPHAAVNEAVNIAKKRGHQGISGMVNGVLRNVLRQKETLKLPEGLPDVQRIALAESHPEWMVEGWIHQYGAETAEAICRADNEPPSVSVRINRTKTDRDSLLNELAKQGFDAVPSTLSEDGLIVRGGGNMALSAWYKEGQLSIQDESSMLVAEAVDARPGMNVLDCCAAPGGKSCHIAERMEGSGTVIANDVHAHKAKLIEEQAGRLGLPNVQTRTGDALELAGSFEPASFDRILLDAPCSGLGVIRRKPDLKWTKSPQDLAEIAQLQQQLLDAVCGLLKPGGVLVYSTCTIERAENAGAVEAFLARHPEFAADESPALFQRLSAAADREPVGLQVLPQDAGSDGFYIARLVKQA